MVAAIGAHLNGGVKGALEHARRIGLGAGLAEGSAGGPIQLWSRNPSAWKSSAHHPADVARFREGCAALELGPVFSHGIYLMNFASRRLVATSLRICGRPSPSMLGSCCGITRSTRPTLPCCT